ncbi:DUF6493 family protein [Actinomadura hibisca]|uniref:DUF6493 family protein n=1 Tax=Actinomadura hibisca TaxID=68565 RepID=UPI000831961E|nr:DUF6493 family protein [Actinomadura hibisca]
MTAWSRARTLIEAGDVPALAHWLADLDAAARQDVARELPGHLSALHGASEGASLEAGAVLPLLVAGVATIESAEHAAAWVSRADLRLWSASYAELTGPLATVAAARPAEWRAEAAALAAERLRAADLRWQDASLWHAAAALAGAAGIEPPTCDGFVVNWVVWGGRPDRLADDPFLDALVPRLFEVEELGRRLVWDKPGDARQASWADALLDLVASGRLERSLILDGCVQRLLSGGRPQDLYWFVRLHDALEPTLEETAARLRDYVRLLPESPPAVATAAFREVRRIDEAGQLTGEAFVETADALLSRPERKLAGAAITWLDRSARKRDRVDVTLHVLTALFAASDEGLRERAAKAVAKHAGRAAAETLRYVNDAAEHLPPHLWGLVAQPADTPPPPARPPAFQPRTLPAPIATPAEAAAAFAAQDHSWPAVECLLDALVRFAVRDPHSLRELLRRALPETTPWAANVTATLSLNSPADWTAGAVRAVLTPRRQDGFDSLMTFHRKVAWHERSPDEPVMHRFLIWRMRELVSTVGRSPLLLATPTEGSGHLDPAALVTRLERLEAAGIEPGPADLVQALLRLPRGVTARTAHLSSPAGRALRAWLAHGGLPDPDVTVDADGTPTVTLPTAVPPAIDRLCTITAEGLWPDRPTPAFYGPHEWWPAILPSHREIVAAHLLPHLAQRLDSDYRQGTTLLGLAEADGPAGAATATALLYGLSARVPAERADAVRALLALCARNRPPAGLGEALATLARRELIKLDRVVEALSEAADAGAHIHVWTALKAALPALLPAPGERPLPGLPALLALATRTVETTRVGGVVPELAAFATRGGNNRAASEAARLHRALTRQGGQLHIRVS